MTIGKFTFTLPPDLRGQLWVAAGVPIGLAVLARAMHELELAVQRRHELLAELEAKIAAKTAEYGRLLVDVPKFRSPEADPAEGELVEPQPCGVCGATVEGGDGLCFHEEPSVNGSAPAQEPAPAG